jgi:glucose-1-phosphate adenylyltransferase
MTKLTAVILGGGQGTRLEPLTKFRAKPAVPIAGKFRLIDIPISNCLHSDIKHIFVLTQFNTESLHRHITTSYRFDNFSEGYIRLLAAQQTVDSKDWYQGTADAVRKNLFFLRNVDDHIIILSGDHLYRMDYREFFEYHLETGADITISVKPIMEQETSGFGILKTGSDGRIISFFEKPKEQKILDEYRVDPALFENFQIEHKNRTHVASMGIYIFNKKVLFDILNSNTMEDFGKQVIPASLKDYNVYAYFYDDYWRDIGNIKSFLEAHLDLTRSVPLFNFYDERHKFYTRPRFLPAAKIITCQINHSLLADGAILLGSSVEESIIGIRSYISEGAHIRRSIIMGCERYETIKERNQNDARGIPNMGIGTNAVVNNSIIDLNARIGRNVKLINKEGVTETFQSNYAIRDGIIIVPKGETIPDDTVI